MTSVQDARAALGRRLRELRRDAGLTGRQLAEALSWPPSKVSKLENGRQTPSDTDIRGWTRVTDSPDAAAALLASLHILEEQHAEWQRLLRDGLRPHQDEITRLNARTRMFRVFESVAVPGMLQTAEYARIRFEQAADVYGAPDDIDSAVRARIQRQEMLYRAEKRFHFVLTEAALRYRLSPPEVMLGQLDRLITLASLPAVRLGVIGFDAPYAVAPSHGFWLLDDTRVQVETFSAELNLAQPQEIALYGRVFDSLAAAASYGRAARAIITRVVDDIDAAMTAVAPDPSDIRET